jgi:hypothetical protein
MTIAQLAVKYYFQGQFHLSELPIRAVLGLAGGWFIGLTTWEDSEKRFAKLTETKTPPSQPD